MSNKFQQRFIVIIIFSVTFLLLARSAFAHKIYVFASVEDSTIKGKVKFARGRLAKGVKVEMFDSEGEKVGETKTNDNGEFSFKPTKKCDYKLVVDLGEGHRDSCKIKASDLPDDLNGSEKIKNKHPKKSRELKNISESELKKIVAKAVHKEVEPLREELIDYKNEVRIHDILGGIGYILGIVGISFYFLGVRRKK